jgi:hypothetical protein
MSIKDPDAVIAIVSALQHAHGDDTARVLAEGVTLAAIIQAVLAGPMSNRDAVNDSKVACRLRDIARPWSDVACPLRVREAGLV